MTTSWCGGGDGGASAPYYQQVPWWLDWRWASGRDLPAPACPARPPTPPPVFRRRASSLVSERGGDARRSICSACCSYFAAFRVVVGGIYTTRRHTGIVIRSNWPRRGTRRRRHCLWRWENDSMTPNSWPVATPRRYRVRLNTAGVRRRPRGPIYKISYDLSYDYRKFIVRLTYDSDLKRAEISLRNIVS